MLHFFVQRLTAIVILMLLVAIFRFWLSSPPPRPHVAPAGGQAGKPSACPTGSRTGRPDLDESLRTPEGLRIVVRTPKDYDPTRAYPLIVVYPPAGLNARRSEAFYNLTTQATRRGFIMAYSDHMPLTREAMAAQAKVAATVQSLFCVEGEALTFLGHSDGGSAAEGLVTFARNKSLPPRIVVASAAGVTRVDLSDSTCPKIPSVMILHNKTDRLFPDLGRGAAEFWRACASCTPSDLNAITTGCKEFRGCAEGRRVVYCETTTPHGRWPEMSVEVLDFIQGKPVPHAQ
jgi:polyhydroxybutyrate depolymerase